MRKPQGESKRPSLKCIITTMIAHMGIMTRLTNG